MDRGTRTKAGYIDKQMRGSCEEPLSSTILWYIKENYNKISCKIFYNII